MRGFSFFSYRQKTRIHRDFAITPDITRGVEFFSKKHCHAPPKKPFSKGPLGQKQSKRWQKEPEITLSHPSKSDRITEITGENRRSYPIL
tara:strand:- start:476 stop:745 length:270 start_codon:yes stop_codon:yes gene_type:complete